MCMYHLFFHYPIVELVIQVAFSSSKKIASTSFLSTKPLFSHDQHYAILHTDLDFAHGSKFLAHQSKIRMARKLLVWSGVD